MATELFLNINLYLLQNVFMKMKVLLLTKIPRVGNKNDIVEVARGYAMNYLFPQNLAKVATPAEEERVTLMKKRQEARIEEMKGAAQDLKAKVDAAPSLSVTVRTTDSGSLYGSVSEKMVADAVMKTHGFEMPESNITMPAHIKGTGEYAVILQFAEGVTSKVTLHVNAE